MSDAAPRRTPPRRRPAAGRPRTTGADSRPDSRPGSRPDSRSVAFAVLRAVSEQDAYANLVLPRLLREARLSPRDAALATELAYGTLRGRGTYDAVLAACSDRPLAAVDPAVLDALRLGAHQLLATRTAAHAAVSETVDLVRRESNRGAAGFTNAVLRKVSRRDLAAWLDEVAPLPGTGTGTGTGTGSGTSASARTDDGRPAGALGAGAAAIDTALAVRTSHPAWMVPALREALGAHGRPAQELDELLAAHNARPRVTLAALPGLVDPATVIAEVDGPDGPQALEQGSPTHGASGPAAPGRWSPTAVVLPGGVPAKVPAVAGGRARVQDEGSQLVALALLAAPVLDAPVLDAPVGGGPELGGAGASAPERWLDLCAGPGGKAALLAASSAAPGGPAGDLTAVELAPHRARLVRSALAPLDASTWEVVVADGRLVGEQQPGGFDRVLLDAPCTGTGALRRRPEARWRRTEGDLADLTVLQRELLTSALAAVRPGGVVAYSTCSPLASETVGVVDAVLAGRDDVELLDAPRALAAAAGRPVPDVGEGPTAQLWTHRHGTDAMFLALLRRR